MITLRINPANARDKDDNLLTFDQVKAAIQRAVDTWNGVAHSYATLSVSNYPYSGNVNNGDGVSTVTFEGMDILGGSNGGAWTFPLNGGVINEVDLIFHSDNRWNTDITYPSSYPTYDHPANGTIGPVDLEHVAAHELGHGVGLHHVGDGYTLYTMHTTNYEATDWWENTHRRSLELGDQAGKAYQDPDFSSATTQEISKMLLSAPNTVSIEGDFTAPAGSYFEIEAGKTIKMSRYVDLIVNGTLVAVGTQSEPITLTRSDPSSSSKTFWQGTKVYNPGTFTLDYVFVYGATNGLYSSYATGSILNSHFEEDYFGTYLYHSDNVTIDYNEYVNNTFGIYLNYSDPSVRYSQFSGNSYGFRFYKSSGLLKENVVENSQLGGLLVSNNSSPDLSTFRAFPYNYHPVNNVIENNSQYGMNICSDCTPNLGIYYEEPKYMEGGFNHFILGAGTYDVKSDYPGTIFAEVNWWDSMNNSGFVEVDPTAESLFGPPGKMLVGAHGTGRSLQDLLLKAYGLEADSAFSEAIDKFNELISLASDEPIAHAAVNGIVRNFKHLENNAGLIDDLNNIFLGYSQDLAGIAALDFSVTAYAHQGDFLEALSRSADIIEIYSSAGFREKTAWSIYEQGLIYETIAASGTVNDGLSGGTGFSELARESFLRVLRDYPETDAADFLAGLFGEISPGSGLTSTMTVSLLDQAHPNPFNPSTSITYHLPEVSDVNLVIYDLVGREVFRLVNGRRIGGTYRMIWDGKDSHGNPVSSGMYLYKLDAISRESDKEFHQTRKMVLLR